MPAHNTWRRKPPVLPVSVFSSVIGARLLDTSVWKTVYANDKDCTLIVDLVTNPSLVKKVNLENFVSFIEAPSDKTLSTLSRKYSL